MKWRAGPRVIYWNSISSPYIAEPYYALAARGAIQFEA